MKRWPSRSSARSSSTAAWSRCGRSPRNVLSPTPSARRRRSSRMPETASPAAPAGGISQLAEHLFRQESGKLVSVLTGIFGIDRLQLAEDVVQEALIRALQTWPYYGIPKNPAAWLTQTAKNLAVDLIRREKLFSDKQPQIIFFIEQWSSACNPEDSVSLDNEIK